MKAINTRKIGMAMIWTILALIVPGFAPGVVKLVSPTT